MKRVLFLALCFGLSAFSVTEIVQTVPLETSLAIEEIRDAKAVWLEMIREAKESVDLEHFYITDGEPLSAFFEALREISAKARVRLIVDKVFYDKYPEDPNQWAKTTIQVRVLDFKPGIQHAKYFIVDGKNAFLGSHNLDWRALTHIHEVGARITNSFAIRQMQSIFEQDWTQATSIGIKTTFEKKRAWVTESWGEGNLEIIASPKAKNPKGVGDSLSAVLNLLNTAKKNIFIEVMDYSPTMQETGWALLDDALRAAARRGVSVRLMLDHGHYLRAKGALDSLARVNNVTVKNVNIPEHSSGPIPYARLIHAKFLVVDEARAWLGTENWSGDYFTNSRNVGLVTSEIEPVRSLVRIFEKVWNSSYASTVRANWVVTNY